jgi:hypothetical protein
MTARRREPLRPGRAGEIWPFILQYPFSPPSVLGAVRMGLSNRDAGAALTAIWTVYVRVMATV